MPPQTRGHMARRRFLGVAAGMVTGGFCHRRARAEDRPTVTNPRATSGDDVVEPDWQERLTVTVGPRKADVVGESDKAIQAAVDYVTRWGGGTVKILPGTYRLRNAIYLASRVRILGSGGATILLKEPSTSSGLREDSDWYDQEITLENADGFRIGDGVCLQTRNPHHGGKDVLKRTLVARSGNRFKLDQALRKNFWLSGKPTVSTLFPILSGENVTDVVIENLALDGNKANNENLNGNYAGGIFLQDCSRVTMRAVETRNYNGDGISWQICHDVLVENCHSHDNTGLGLHPGSGSQRPIMRDNRLERNDIGIFFCWGVRYGLAERNRIDEAGRFGISIGHCDTDNLVCDNEVRRSGKVGLLFRDDARGKDFWPNRNRIVNNRILDSGAEDGIGVDIQGQAKDLVITGNEIRETRAPASRTGMRIGAKVGSIQLADNRIEGFAVPITDLRNH